MSVGFYRSSIYSHVGCKVLSHMCSVATTEALKESCKLSLSWTLLTRRRDYLPVKLSLKPDPFSSSSGMKTRLVQGHVWVYIISASTRLPIARLEVLSGTSYYYLFSRWNQNCSQSVYIFICKGKSVTLSISPPLSTLQQYQPTL